MDGIQNNQQTNSYEHVKWRKEAKEEKYMKKKIEFFYVKFEIMIKLNVFVYGYEIRIGAKRYEKEIFRFTFSHVFHLGCVALEHRTRYPL